jgi:hypothetical protein
VSVKEHQCLILVCDGCGREYEQDYVVHVDVGDESMAREMAADGDDWFSHGGRDRCLNCRMEPHAYVAINNTCVCGFCGWEHDEEAADA